MHIILGNYLLLQEISVTGQLSVWVAVILLVSLVVYLLLRKLNNLQGYTMYNNDEMPYIRSERLKYMAGNQTKTGPSPDVDQDATEPVAEPPPLNDFSPVVEYISVARPRPTESVTESDVSLYNVEKSTPDDPPSSTKIIEDFTSDLPSFMPDNENGDTTEPRKDGDKINTTNPVLFEDTIAGHIQEYTADYGHLTEPEYITRPVSAADDIIAEQHTEAIPADELILPIQAAQLLYTDKTVIEEAAVANVDFKNPAVGQSGNEATTEATTFNKEYTNIPTNQSQPDTSAVLNSLSDIIFEYNKQKRCVNIWYNKSGPSVIDLEIFRGKTVTEAMGPEKAKVINDAIDFVTENVRPATIEFPSFYGPGKWFKSKISPVFDNHYKFTGHTTSLVSDISEQRRLDAEQLQKHLLLVAAQKIACLGSWMYDLVGKQTNWSDNLYALLDIDTLPHDTYHFEYYISHVVADDRRAVYQFFADVNGEKHRVNHHRVITDKGNLKYFRIVRGEPVRDANGNIIRTTGIIQDVSENQEIERNIRKTQAELTEAQAIAKIGNWKWYTANKELTLTNELYKIYEVDPQILANGISPFKLLLKFVHRDDKAALLGCIKTPAGKSRTSCEYRIITASGQLKYLCLIVARVNQREDGRIRTMTGTLQDITERKEAQLNIQQTEDNYKLVLESIKLAAISLDKNGEIIFCNKYLATLLGYEQQELIGLNWYNKFISENLIPIFKEWYQSNHFKTEYVSPVICRNGEERVISWQNTTLYDDDGQIKQTTSIGEDVTDQQKDRDFLISEKEKAEKLSILKSEFMSVMSHEIRTPMNAVIGTTNLLLDENPRPDQVDYLNNLKFSGQNLLGIIDDILDYNKIDAGKLELNKTNFDIYKLAANIKQTFLANALEKKLEIFVETDEHIPNNLIGDPTRLGQILNNLVSNAIKFTSKGSITLLIQEDLRDDKHIKLKFTVADTGVGIDQKHLQKIFEPFEQQPQHRDSGGTGLGLAIIKRLVELHGGKINVKSTTGRGTQFTFDIKFEYNADHTPKAEPALAPTPREADLTGMKVLVVDDNKLNMLIACRFLQKWNVITNEASNGHMATEMANSNQYDLILMDLQMPVMDGFDARRIIKETRPNMPVIAITADAMPETFAKTVEYGFNDYLVKPFMPEMLFEKVAKYYTGN